MKFTAFIFLVLSLGALSSANAGGLPEIEIPESVLLDTQGAPLPDATTNLLMSLDARLGGHQSAIRTTIDADLQSVLRNEIQGTGRKFSALRGAALLMDVHTGSILAAMSETMTGEPSAFLAEPVELGATLMTIMVAAALDAEAIHVTDTFDVSRPIRVGRRIVNDYARYDGRMGVMHILQESSNIGSAQIGIRLGYQRYQDFLEKIDLVTLPTKVLHSEETVATISYGHNLEIFPVRLVAAYSTLTNGGYKVSPSLVPGADPDRMSVISEELSATMRGYLGNAVQNGTGFKARHSAIEIVGKTGTTDKLNGVISSFIAVFPIYEPKYALYVAFDEPTGIDQTHSFSTGGWVAAPAACKIIAAIASHLGLAQTGACSNL